MYLGAPQGPLDPAQAEAYRQGYVAGQKADASTKLGEPFVADSRRKWLAFGTLLFGLGTAAAVLAYRSGYETEASAVAIGGGVSLAILGAAEVLVTPGKATPRYGIAGLLGRG